MSRRIFQVLVVNCVLKQTSPVIFVLKGVFLKTYNLYIVLSAICVSSWRRGKVREVHRPHYKFNLTNGSENLETMDYMKCGYIYHTARHRVSLVTILSEPIHILLEWESHKEWETRKIVCNNRWNFSSHSVLNLLHKIIFSIKSFKQENYTSFLVHVNIVVLIYYIKKEKLLI